MKRTEFRHIDILPRVDFSEYVLSLWDNRAERKDGCQVYPDGCRVDRAIGDAIEKLEDEHQQQLDAIAEQTRLTDLGRTTEEIFNS